MVFMICVIFMVVVILVIHMIVFFLFTIIFATFAYFYFLFRHSMHIMCCCMGIDFINAVFFKCVFYCICSIVIISCSLMFTIIFIAHFPYFKIYFICIRYGFISICNVCF